MEEEWRLACCHSSPGRPRRPRTSTSGPSLSASAPCPWVRTWMEQWPKCWTSRPKKPHLTSYGSATSMPASCGVAVYRPVNAPPPAECKLTLRVHAIDTPREQNEPPYHQDEDGS